MYCDGLNKTPNNASPPPGFAYSPVRGEEQFSFIDGCQMEWAALQRPPAPITVGIDGGYVKKWDDKKTHFEVIVGKQVYS